MCYAFSDRMEKSTSVSANITEVSNCDQVQYNVIEARSAARPPKRAADTTLEHQQAKVAKTSDFEAGKDSNVTPDAKDEEIAELKARIVSLERVQKRLEGEKIDLQYEVSELEVRENQRKDVGKETLRHAEGTIKAHWKKKWEDAKLELLKKHEKDLTKKVEEVKLKNQRLEDDNKEMKADHAQAEREMKAEHQRIQKELKAEYQSELKLWKPEHSNAVKEKDSLLKAKLKEIKELSWAKDYSKTQTEKLESNAKSLTEDKQKLLAALQDAYTKLYDKEQDFSREEKKLKASLNEKNQQINECHAKIKLEGDRWQLQYNRAEKFSHDFMTEHRINLILRGENERKDKRIEEVQVELMAAHGQIQSLKQVDKVVAEDGAVEKQEDGTVVNGDGGGQSETMNHSDTENPSFFGERDATPQKNDMSLSMEVAPTMNGSPNMPPYISTSSAEADQAANQREISRVNADTPVEHTAHTTSDP